MSGINVAVTGLHAADNPAPGIGVIRSLKHPKGWDGLIIGLAYDVFDTGIYDHDLLDATFLISYPNQSSEQAFDRLMYIHERVRIDVLIPTLDSEIALYQKLAPRLRQAGIKLYIPDERMVKTRTKVNLPIFCQEFEISTPKTITINDPNRFDKAVEEIGLPLYVKGVFYEAYLCHSRDDAYRYLEKLRAQWGLPILLQEAINGEEFDVCVVGKSGELIGVVPIRKTRLTDKGKAWAAVTLRNQELHRFSEHVIKSLVWSGPCELEILQESRSKKLYLLEINPRFPAWIFLGTGAEQNLPKVIVDLALGKNVEPLPPAKSGITFVRHATDLVCPMEYIESLTVHGELHYKMLHI